jgi:hypothetical protein
MNDLIDEIRQIRQELRRRKDETSSASHILKTCKQEEKKTLVRLEKLLDELQDGRSHYPLLEQLRTTTVVHERCGMNQNGDEASAPLELDQKRGR